MHVGLKDVKVTLTAATHLRLGQLDAHQIGKAEFAESLKPDPVATRTVENAGIPWHRVQREPNITAETVGPEPHLALVAQILAHLKPQVLLVVRNDVTSTLRA